MREKLRKESFVSVPYRELDITYFPTDKPFMEIRTNGIVSSSERSYPKMKKIKNSRFFKGKEKLGYAAEEKERIGRA